MTLENLKEKIEEMIKECGKNGEILFQMTDNKTYNTGFYGKDEFDISYMKGIETNHCMITLKTISR